VVKFLVEEAGADVESKDNISAFTSGGRTPLSWAAGNGHLEVVALLVEEAGADVESKDNRGRTTLSWAAENGHLDVVKVLVREGGADVESRDEDGQTPLSFAAMNGHLDVVKSLVKEAGADVVESKDYVGLTALDLAKVAAGREKRQWETEERCERRREGCRAVAAWLEKEAAIEGSRRIMDRSSRPGLT